MSNYHQWLCRQRLYCQHGACMERATRVLTIHGADEVRCNFHGYSPRTTTTNNKKETRT